MKRYILFSGETYYPSGGMGDYTESFALEEEAIAEMRRISEEPFKWAHVFDSAEGKTIYPE